MLSDEEKKAIEKFKNFIYTYQDVIEDEYSDYEEKESAKEYQEVSEKILNIIEKQSKEIEELKKYKEGYKLLSYSLDNYTSNDKIKAKIEYKKDKLRQIQNSNDRYRIMCLQVEIDMLQSLLEKGVDI